MNKKDLIIQQFKNFNFDTKGLHFVEENSTTTVYYYGDIHLESRNLKKIPFFLDYVFGSFYCHDNQLTNLENCPIFIENVFDCSDNLLEDLTCGCQEVGDYIANSNHLKNLKGIPQIIKGHLFLYDNQIDSLEYFPDQVDGACWMFTDNDKNSFMKKFNSSDDSFYSENNFVYWKEISLYEKSLKEKELIISQLDMNHHDLKNKLINKGKI